MASIVGYVPLLGEGEAMPAWMHFDWSAKVQHDIYRDWGTYYSSRRRENFALYYLTQALLLQNDDWSTMYRRSLTRGKAADIPAALLDAITAEEMALNDVGPNCPINLQICDCLFNLNKFETCKATLHNNLRRFMGIKAKNFEKRLIVIDDVIRDVTGKALSLFYLRNQKLVRHVSELIRASEIVDDRPKWKILKEQGKCDIQSIPDEEEIFLSPLEIARRKRAFNVIHQTYLNESWYDVLFLKNLRTNPSLLLRQCKNSRQFLETLVNKQYDVVRRFIKMIHSRSPLYYVSFLKFKNKKMLEKNKEAYLFRIQYQTHRNMIHDLRQIHKLRKEKKVKQLSSYVEKIMGDYYVTKTNRVMCWKFEFYNEVYNSVALALAEQYSAPKDIKKSKITLLEMLLLPKDKFKEATPFVFGDRSTYTDGDYQDPVAIRSRKLISRLEKRIRFAKFSIEKCYLYHQIGDIHLSQLRYDECCLNARRAIKETQNCNSNIWKFLSMLLIIKANALQQKVEKTKEAADEAIPVAEQLKSPRLMKFIDACYNFAVDDFRRKAASLAVARASRASLGDSLGNEAE
ncbi:PREDICTED: uncharacterized protein LOC108617211 [Drosophila arizonae]|uniref:Uncharacterized protein LOC108617211 n=1 Tax=Drosophila arizonae TaxID=7263 RepID=A0ABM1PMI6_DROAR|nr:PREDICTED: uncharacterized protein LOC108617211 [Drosophila arizonae]